MHATETEGVELASYRLKGVAYSLFELWEESREDGSPPSRWGEFTDAFMDHFFPVETKASRVAEFVSLKQGCMNVWEYHMEFVHLSKYAIHMLPTMDARVCRFVQGLSPLVINEATTTTLISDMYYGKTVAFSQAIETRKLKNRMERQSSSKARSAGNFGGSSGGGGGTPAVRGGSTGPSQSFAQSLISVQSSGPSQGNREPHQQGRPDRSSTLSYVTPYVAVEFGIEPEQLPEPFYVSTPVDESIMATRVYRGCVFTIRGRDTVADLIELGMVDFDVNMGMDWLYSYFAKLDYRTRTVRFEFPNELVVE
ncbi:uncharacterized protein [Nicotiana tomentosiformis]|uniref:uncharacterized protein n=1 Tax=Nicotiana tomentosiformis TaxID=4098 RepID=UPI00388C4456